MLREEKTVREESIQEKTWAINFNLDLYGQKPSPGLLPEELIYGALMCIKGTLTEKQQKIICMHYIDEMDNIKIAEELSLPSRQIQPLLLTAQRKLRNSKWAPFAYLGAKTGTETQLINWWSDAVQSIICKSVNEGKVIPLTLPSMFLFDALSFSKFEIPTRVAGFLAMNGYKHVGDMPLDSKNLSFFKKESGEKTMLVIQQLIHNLNQEKEYICIRKGLWGQEAWRLPNSLRFYWDYHFDTMQKFTQN